MQTETIRAIRRRLFMLLLRAFAVSVVLTLVFMLVSTAVLINRTNQRAPFVRLNITPLLETYYLSKGTWDGVQNVFASDVNGQANREWNDGLLLDAKNQVIANHGSVAAPNVGNTYTPKLDDKLVPLHVNGTQVGSFVVSNGKFPTPEGFIFDLLGRVALLSTFFAISTILIAMWLLSRRIITPLAQVTGAARAVTDGQLGTRVKIEGDDDLGVLSQSFNQMAEALERNDQERRNLFADIAHELRTPLSVLRGRLEGIVDGVYQAEPEQIVPALEETYLLERLVDDLRLLTMAETRQLHYDLKQVDLAELAGRAIDLFRAEADEKRIELSLQTATEKAEITADPLRTEQVIGNLLSNALRYVPEGGKIWIEVERLGDRVVLSIDDSGPGIPEADLPYIFDRFWRGDKSRSRSSGGAGLGLAIARQLVEAQGGRITASNLPDSGLQIKCEFSV
jgi:two-component system OmpR family sensor kinase/two-component system sensor histidine kinase BaeS